MYKTHNLAEIPTNFLCFIHVLQFLLYNHNLSRYQTRFRFFEQNLIFWHSVRPDKEAGRNRIQETFPFYLRLRMVLIDAQIVS